MEWAFLYFILCCFNNPSRNNKILVNQNYKRNGDVQTCYLHFSMDILDHCIVVLDSFPFIMNSIVLSISSLLFSFLLAYLTSTSTWRNVLYKNVLEGFHPKLKIFLGTGQIDEAEIQLGYLLLQFSNSLFHNSYTRRIHRKCIKHMNKMVTLRYYDIAREKGRVISHSPQTDKGRGERRDSMRKWRDRSL